MAKATATCTCATCGAMFTRTKICRNRREADGWEVWAAANFDECDACYTARKASEREAAAAAETELPLTLHMTGYPYKDSTPVVLFFGGDTMPHKDDIKALGYRWVFADDYITYGYSVQRGEQKWIKVVPQEDAYDEIKRAKALGAVIDDSIVDTEYLAKQAAAKRERVAAAEASGITEPVKPVCYQDEFGPAAEDDSRTVMSLSVRADTADKARRAAAASGCSISEYVEHALLAQLGGDTDA